MEGNMTFEEVKELFKKSIDATDNMNQAIENLIQSIYLKGYNEALEQEPKIWHCKDCKWWKDSDGTFRRGIGAESQCPINHKEVYEGNGYCFMFEPQESEEKDAT